MSKPPLLPPRTLGEYLRSVRTGWGWTMTQMAAGLNCDTSSISTWEAGKTLPTGTALVGIACFLGMSVEHLTDANNHYVPAVPTTSIPAFSHMAEVIVRKAG